jgi:hypothetical protein
MQSRNGQSSIFDALEFADSGGDRTGKFSASQTPTSF